MNDSFFPFDSLFCWFNSNFHIGLGIHITSEDHLSTLYVVTFQVFIYIITDKEIIGLLHYKFPI